MSAIAHTGDEHGTAQSMQDHLERVAALAHRSLEQVGLGQTGRLLGLVHDIGKYRPGFQQYLSDAKAGRPATSVDHKFAGSWLLCEEPSDRRLAALSVAVAGHHGGLERPHDVLTWMRRMRAGTTDANALRDYATSRASAEHDLGSALQDAFEHAEFPSTGDARLFARLLGGRLGTTTPDETQRLLAGEFMTRVLFSALVDADGLDTEQHFAPEQAAARRGTADLAEIWQRFSTMYSSSLNQREPSPIDRHRADIYDEVTSHAHEPTGFWTLPAPTGSGKTLTSLSFGIQHALAHGLERVIFVVPYLTITEQTADVYRSILGDDAVLEHHSDVDLTRFDSRLGVWNRLAAHNWDAPVIVTTSAQLIRTLGAAGVSRSRRLHRLLRSVIVIDEAQTLPPHLLVPTLDSLRRISETGGASIVMATATPPSFETIAQHTDLNWRPLLSNPSSYERTFRRVEYDWRRVKIPMAWTEVANKMSELDQVLTIVNTTADAATLHTLLNDAYHLSTRMCQAHRAHVLDEIRTKLAAGRPCRVVSTQLIEAGIDVDFPVVYRALGPLDSMVQAGGRCNREGRLRSGVVHIFEPIDAKLPPGVYTEATAVTRDAVLPCFADPTSLEALHAYFARLYGFSSHDRHGIQQLRSEWNFPEIENRLRLIEEETRQVIVRYDAIDDARIRDLEREALLNPERLGGMLRTVTPFVVSISQYQWDRASKRGLLRPFAGGDLGVWEGPYVGSGIQLDLAAPDLIY